MVSSSGIVLTHEKLAKSGLCQLYESPLNTRDISITVSWNCNKLMFYLLDKRWQIRECPQDCSRLSYTLVWGEFARQKPTYVGRLQKVRRRVCHAWAVLKILKVNKWYRGLLLYGKYSHFTRNDCRPYEIGEIPGLGLDISALPWAHHQQVRYDIWALFTIWISS